MTLEQKQDSAGSNKKTYQKPELEVFGSLAEITKTAGNHGRLDGGSNSGHTKTH